MAGHHQRLTLAIANRLIELRYDKRERGYMKLSGRTAIVTGSARGIGYAIAEKFASEGANVVLLDIISLDNAVARLALPPERLLAMKADITSESDIQQAVDATIEKFGAIDILVNNAAIADNIKVAPFEEHTVAEWRHMLEVNVIGTFIVCRAVSPHMRKAGYGRIVNIASGTAFKGNPGMLHYVASKGAVISMTRTLATEFGSDNIVVNAVSPGVTETEAALGFELPPGTRERVHQARAIQRAALPDDVAAAVYLLSLEEARFVTGQMMPADGGSVMVR
jgi:NAD(P)-dependent dehydrogenase (short-subunit alcohol dehydrogenase family)